MRKARFFRNRGIGKKREQFHDRLVERIYRNPDMLTIDGQKINPFTVKSRKKEMFFGNDAIGYQVDVAFLRKKGYRVAEVDIIEVVTSPTGKSMETDRIDLLTKLVPYCLRYSKDFINQLREEMGFKPEYYDRLWIDIFSAFPYVPDIKFERLLSYTKKSIELGNAANKEKGGYPT